MLSNNNRRILEAYIVLLGMVVMTIWYARPQLIYSLFIGYDIVRTYFPQFLPLINPIVQSL